MLRDNRDPGRAAGRFPLSAVTAIAVITSLAACVKTTAGNQPSPTVQATTVAMGTRIETPAGNSVIVYSFLRSVGKAPGTNMVYAAADIKACGGPHATSVTAVVRTLFDIETPDAHAWPSVPAVKKPELKPTLLAPNKCEAGWVTFIIPQTPKPVYVVFDSSGLVKWKIP